MVAICGIVTMQKNTVVFFPGAQATLQSFVFLKDRSMELTIPYKYLAQIDLDFGVLVGNKIRYALVNQQ